MFRQIMVPVDLAHLGKLERALKLAAEEARNHDATVTYVSVTSAAPGPLGHNPEEFGEKLEAFAEGEAARHGISAKAHVIVSHDPTTDVDDALLKVADEIDADLILMASHRPGMADYFWPSNGGKVAAHSNASVLVVRDR